jgi:mRNA interferase MazF
MVSAQEYLPDAGDLIWLDFTPQAGREQAGRRPGLVLTPRAYNMKTSLAIVCPITSQVKGYPFEVALPPGGKIGGVVLSDHLNNLAWRQRRATKAGKVSPEVLRIVRERIAALLELA